MRPRSAGRLCGPAAAVLCLACAGTAHANAGTAALMPCFCHAVVLNWLIAAGEAGLLVWLLGARFGRAYWLMLAANYLSWGAAWSAAAVLYRCCAPLSATAALPAVVVGWSGLFLTTVLLEWPFCRLAGAPSRTTWVRALWVSLVVQAASYAALALVYAPAQDLSLVRETRPDSGLLAEQPDDAVVYYVSPDWALMRLPLRDGPAEVVLADRVPEDYSSDGATPVAYFALVASADGDAFDLALRPGEDTTEVIVQPFATRLPVRLNTPDWQLGKPYLALTPRGLLDLRSVGTVRGWQLGEDTAGGLRIFDRTTRETTLRVGLTTSLPLMDGCVGTASLLPGDRVVFQLGSEILLFDVPTRRICHLAWGHDPVVVMRADMP